MIVEILANSIRLIGGHMRGIDGGHGFAGDRFCFRMTRFEQTAMHYTPPARSQNPPVRHQYGGRTTRTRPTPAIARAMARDGGSATSERDDPTASTLL